MTQADAAPRHRRRHPRHHRHLSARPCCTARQASSWSRPTRPRCCAASRPSPTAGYPYFVAELDGRVAGYAYANAYRTRPAYRFTVEDSIYIAPDAQGKGIGRALLARLIDTCTAQGFRLMIAVIGDSAQSRLDPPAPARRLHLLRHHPLGRLQVRPLARQRHHGAAAGRGRHSPRPSSGSGSSQRRSLRPPPAARSSPARPARGRDRGRA